MFAPNKSIMVINVVLCYDNSQPKIPIIHINIKMNCNYDIAPT